MLLLIAQRLGYVIAIFTFIGSIGLILPTALGRLTWITPITALILSMLMLFSIFFHIKCREKPNITASVILFALAAFVAYGRWVLAPL